MPPAICVTKSLALEHNRGSQTYAVASRWVVTGRWLFCAFRMSWKRQNGTFLHTIHRTGKALCSSISLLTNLIVSLVLARTLDNALPSRSLVLRRDLQDLSFLPYRSTSGYNKFSALLLWHLCQASKSTHLLLIENTRIILWPSCPRRFQARCRELLPIPVEHHTPYWIEERTLASLFDLIPNTVD